MNSSIRSISNSQHNKECGRSYSQLLSLEVWWHVLSDALQMIQQKIGQSLRNVKNRKFFTMILARVAQVDAALKVIVSTRTVNARLLAGLVLVGIITPIADIFYTFLPEGRVPQAEWYYESYYWLFLCLGPYIQILTGLIGVYLIMFPSWNRKAYLFIAPLGFALTKIVWLWNVDSHEEFLQVPPVAYFIYTFCFTGLVMVLSDYLAWRKYHRADAHERRMDGLCQIADMNNPIQRGFVETWKEMKAKNY
jgi:hypothetical protein